MIRVFVNRFRRQSQQVELGFRPLTQRPLECFRTCVASLLPEMDVDDVPHQSRLTWTDYSDGKSKINHPVVPFLNQRGLTLEKIKDSERPEGLWIGIWTKEYCAPDDCHAVVMKGSEVFHDPNAGNPGEKHALADIVIGLVVRSQRGKV